MVRLLRKVAAAKTANSVDRALKSSEQINSFFLSGGNEVMPHIALPLTCIYFKLKN